jgi:hypothetical protein
MKDCSGQAGCQSKRIYFSTYQVRIIFLWKDREGTISRAHVKGDKVIKVLTDQEDKTGSTNKEK